MLPEVTLARFLLLPELIVTYVHLVRRAGAIYGVRKTSKFEVCPKCANPSHSIYDHRVVKVKDEPIRGKYVILKIKKRRFFCKNCRKPFTEPITGIGKSMRTTHRYRRSLLWAAENFADLTKVQRAYRCSRGLLYRVVYEQLEQKRRTRLYEFPALIGIDEYSFRKPKYSPVEYATVIVDHKGKRIYDLIDGRSKAELEKAAIRFKRPDNVKAVTIDLSPSFKSFAKSTFKNARIIADRFHVQRLFIRLVNKFRKQITGDRRSHPMRKLLMRDGSKLQAYERRAIKRWLAQFPDLEKVYEIKESVHRFYRIRGKNRAKKALLKIYHRMGLSKIPELVNLRKSLLAWKDEIVEYFDGRFSNGRVEGFNRKAKLVQRRAYGFKSFKNYKLQLLHTCRGKPSRRSPTMN